MSKNVYVIGSLSRATEIQYYAGVLSLKTNSIVNYVTPQPDKPLEELISKCFDNINKADMIVVFPKKDGTIGDGTLYEMEYARRLGKKIEIIK